ncbi:Ig-like domain-containing protein [Lachnospiraceae bacterium 45-W7]
MKQKLSMFLALVMFLTTVLVAPPQTVVQAAEMPTVVVKGGDVRAAGDNSSYAIETGTVSGGDGKATFCKITSTQYSNGVWDVNFTAPGRYQISFLAEVEHAPETFCVFNVRDSGEETVYSDTDHSQKLFEKTNQGEYREFDCAAVDIAEAGNYVFKIGEWGKREDGELDKGLRIQEIRFKCLKLIDPDAYEELNTEEELELSETFASNKQGTLNPITDESSYLDYKIDVKQAGDYTITYLQGKNAQTDHVTDAGIEGSFQTIINPGAENEAKSAPVNVPYIWGDFPTRQTIHLDAGKQVLRIQALKKGGSVKKVSIKAKTVHEIEEDTMIAAGEFINASDKCGIEGAGNISYAPQDLELAYAVQVAESGTYMVSYNYVSKNDTFLRTKVDGEDAAESQIAAFAGEGDWYAGEYQDSEAVGIQLQAGQHVLSTVWGSADLNVKSLKLKKVKEASAEATDLGKDTPAEFTDEIGGANGLKDYELNVKDAGDYTVTYTVAAVEAAEFAAGTPGIQSAVNPDESDKVEHTVLELSKFTDAVQVKETINLNMGSQILRVQTLAEGVKITKIEIAGAAAKTHTVKGSAVNDKTVIQANEYESRDGYHASDQSGNIVYASKGLKLNYAIDVQQAGTYAISYKALAGRETVLATRVDGTKVAESTVSAGQSYTDTAAAEFKLKAGNHKLTLDWADAEADVASLELTLKKIPEPVVIVAEAEDGAEGEGSWNVTVGEETAADGAKVTYASYPGQWNNGRSIIAFPNAGIYRMEILAAVPTAAANVHLEYAPEGGKFNEGLKEIALSPTATANTYEWIDTGWEINIEEAGNYDLKFGNWAAGGSDFKVDKFRFTCSDPVEKTEVMDEALVLKKGEALELNESKVADSRKNGSLRRGVAAGNYVDYWLDVKEEGDYTLIYNIAANDSAVEDAFQILVGVKKDEMKDSDFTTKLSPVQLTHYYGAIQQRQSLHLKAGEYILRTKALAEGFGLTKTDIADKIVHRITGDVSGDDGARLPVTVDATKCSDGTEYYAIENNGANIGYAANGLTLKYEIKVEAAGIYNLIYNYTSNGNSSLTAQRTADGKVIDLATSELATTGGGSGNWYDADNYRDSEPEAVLLPVGTYTFLVHWNAADINLKTMTFAYAGSPVGYVEKLLQSLPDKDALTLDDKAAVEKAKNFYDALTALEKAEISEKLVTKLNECLAKINALELVKIKEDEIKDLQKEFARYDQNDYHETEWAQLVAAKDAGITAINAATTITDAQKACKDAKKAMEAVRKKLKPLVLTNSNTIILAQTKAYRTNGFMNSSVQAGNWADYFVDVKEAGDYTFTYALYSDEAVENAFRIKYNNGENCEYPDEVNDIYATVSVPKIETEGNLVKEIRGTVSLKSGEQTIRLYAESDKVRLNRIKITKKQDSTVAAPQPGEDRIFSAANFSDASGSYIISSGVVTQTAAGTVLDYPLSASEQIDGLLSFEYAYAGNRNPELQVSMLQEGIETVLTSVKVGATNGAYADSNGVAIVLPAGSYTLRITMKNDGVDLRSFKIGEKPVLATGISLNVHKLFMDVNDSFQLQAALTPGNTTSMVTWSSSDPTVAAVENGLVRAMKEGTAVITATADRVSITCMVVVGKVQQQQPSVNTPASFIGKVTLYPMPGTLYAGGDANKSATIKPLLPTGASLASVEYSVDNNKVASVSAKGVVTAKKAGKVVVTAKITLTNGETASLSKKITVKKAYIKLKKKTYSVKKGKSVTMKATVYGSSKKISFKMANKASKKLATVTKSGKLTGKKKGTAKVTAYAGKVKLTFKVKIK